MIRERQRHYASVMIPRRRAVRDAARRHVLMLVSEGKTNREIAKALFLGEGTVRNYVSSILSKLGVSNRAEAAAYAVEHSLKDYL